MVGLMRMGKGEILNIFSESFPMLQNDDGHHLLGYYGLLPVLLNLNVKLNLC